MRKNKMMRLASVMLVLTMLTTCAISGTFAKYTTQDSASDTARVAKWGIVLQADGKLYGENYGTGTNSAPTTDTTVANLSVDADANAVAPGTENKKGLSFSVNGTPEVRTELKATITCQNIYLAAGKYALMVAAPSVTATSFVADTYYTQSGDAYTLANTFSDSASYFSMEDIVDLESKNYYPVIYQADITTGNTEADSLMAIAADYAKKLNGGTEVVSTEENDLYTYTITSKVYDPNFDYSSLEVADESLTWAWAYEGQNDGADTILANLQAGAAVVDVDTLKAPVEHEDYNLETSFSIDITVTQVD